MQGHIVQPNPVNFDLWHSIAEGSGLKNKRSAGDSFLRLHSNTASLSCWKNHFHTIKQRKLWKISVCSKQAGKQGAYCSPPLARFSSDVWRVCNHASAQCVHITLIHSSVHYFKPPLLCLCFHDKLCERLSVTPLCLSLTGPSPYLWTLDKPPSCNIIDASLTNVKGVAE